MRLKPSQVIPESNIGPIADQVWMVATDEVGWAIHGMRNLACKQHCCWRWENSGRNVVTELIPDWVPQIFHITHYARRSYQQSTDPELAMHQSALEKATTIEAEEWPLLG
jgi:hypothetical protein